MGRAQNSWGANGQHSLHDHMYDHRTGHWFAFSTDGLAEFRLPVRLLLSGRGFGLACSVTEDKVILSIQQEPDVVMVGY